MKQKKIVNTKLEILHCATKLFVEKGYTTAYITTIAKTLNISTGNLTFHFPTKEHILAGLVKELCEFQWYVEDEEAENYEKAENAAVILYLLELVMFASVCEENSNIKDLVIAAYTHPLSLEFIRKNDTKRLMRVFREFCPDWMEIDFIRAENIVSGIECSMFMTVNTEKLSFEQRVTSCLDAIMKIYNVPKVTRENVIERVMAINYRDKANSVYKKFCEYVERKME